MPRNGKKIVFVDDHLGGAIFLECRRSTHALHGGALLVLGR